MASCDCNCHPEPSNREKALDYARGTFSYSQHEKQGINVNELLNTAESILMFLEGDEYVEQLELQLDR